MNNGVMYYRLSDGEMAIMTHKLLEVIKNKLNDMEIGFKITPVVDACKESLGNYPVDFCTISGPSFTLDKDFIVAIEQSEVNTLIVRLNELTVSSEFHHTIKYNKDSGEFYVAAD